jgi:hypothetical protein
MSPLQTTGVTTNRTSFQRTPLHGTHNRTMQTTKKMSNTDPTNNICPKPSVQFLLDRYKNSNTVGLNNKMVCLIIQSNSDKS